MNESRDPRVFLGRSGYRTRRLRDAAIMLPLLGMLLWNLPLVWKVGPETPRTSAVLLLIFGVWMMLIMLAFALARPTKLTDEESDEGEPR